jgi:hypothetical protein
MTDRYNLSGKNPPAPGQLGATELATTGEPVSSAAAAPPSIGQVPTATSPTTWTWQTPAGGGAQLNVANTWTKKQTFTPDDANIAVEATGGSGQGGVKGTGGAPNGYGIEGWAGAGSTGKGVIGWGAIGVDGRGINGIGVQGIGANGAYVGVYGAGGSSGGIPGSEGIGVLGSGGNSGVPFTGNGQGVYGRGCGGGINGTGVEGEGGFNNGIGVKGSGKGTGAGVYGVGGVAGNSNGVEGLGNGSGQGVNGQGGSSNGIGVKGTGAGTTGSNGQGAGIYGIGSGLGTYGGGSGVFGCVTGNDGYGVFGFGGKAGVKGIGTTSTGTRAGVVGMGSPFAAEIFSYLQQGVIGQGFDSGCGVQGIGGTSNGVGGVFSGDAVVPTMPTAGQGVYGQGGNNGAGVHGKGHGTGRGVYGEGGNNGGTGVYGSVEWHGGGYGVEAHGDVGDPSPVRSSLRVGPQDNDPSTALNGDIMTTSASHPRGAGRIRLYNGTAWLDVGNALKLVTKKSANYTAGYNERVPYDPAAAQTLKPPASPSLGDKWAIKNVTTDTTAITVDGNGQNIEDLIAGGAPVASFTLGVANVAAEWVFMNSNSGNAWHVI